MMAGSQPRYSVVIPTCGPATYLRQVLTGLSTQSVQNFETIVVDNNTDSTVDLSDMPSPGVRLTVIRELRNGLNYARNAGVSCASGAYIAFLDDDGVPSETWLSNLVRGIDCHQAELGGGTVKLVLPSEEPSWFFPELRALLSELLYEGKDIAEIGADRYIVGANMCVSRKAFEMIGGFDPSFDRTATTLRSSGELEFSKRLQHVGGRVAFIASAEVFHHIPAHRMTQKYFVSRAYWQGRSDALLECKWGRPISFGVRNNRKNLLELLRTLSHLRFSGEDSVRFRRYLQVVREYGYCLQYALPTRSVPRRNNSGLGF